MKPGDPKAVRHLRPQTRPQSGIAEEMMNYPVTAEGFDDDYDVATMTEVFDKLALLRYPFPPELVEKRPQGTIPNAEWKQLPKASCDVCGGYHPTRSTIHLDYIGHANTTNRLLEVDPLWEWEPLAYTEAGTPLFTDGGLWIKLTICGVTRLGFGDGQSVKEVIGDAIRNAAMRFGVALDMWAKVDLHQGRITEDGAASARRSARQGDEVRRGSSGGKQQDSGGVAPDAAPRPANQDALDSLQSVCDEYGYSTQYCIDRYARENGGVHIADAGADAITNFAAILIAEATPEADGESTDDGSAGVGEVAPDDTGAVVNQDLF